MGQLTVDDLPSRLVLDHHRLVSDCRFYVVVVLVLVGHRCSNGQETSKYETL